MKVNPVKGFMSVFSAKIINLVILLGFTPILVRLLGPSLYGRYAFIISFIGIAMIIVNFGIFDGLRKHVAESDSGLASYIVAYYIRIASVCLIFSISILLLSNILGITEYILGSDMVIYFYAIIPVIIGRQLFQVVRSSLMGIGFETASELMMVFRKMLFVIASVISIYSGYGVLGVLAGHSISVIFVAIFGFYSMSRKYDFSVLKSPFPNRNKVERMRSYSVSTTIMLLLTFSLYHVDVLLLQPLVGGKLTGIYKASLVLAEFVWFVPVAAQIALIHSSSELWANHNKEKVSNLASKATRYTLVFATIVAMGIWVLADSFIPLYFGQGFSEAVRPLRILIPGALGFAVARPIMAIGQGNGNLRPLIIATGISSGINLLLNLYLIPRIGIMGAATATSVGYGLMLALQIIGARIVGFSPLRDLRMRQYLTTSAATYIIIYILDSIISGNLLSIVVIGLLGGAIYSVLVLRTGLILEEEFDPFYDILPKNERKIAKSTISKIAGNQREAINSLAD